MSVLGGFDFCIELSGGYVAAMVAAQLDALGLGSFRPPFTFRSDSGNAALNITAVTGAVAPGPVFTLTLAYECGEALVLGEWISGENGTIAISIPLTLVHDAAAKTSSIVAATTVASGLRVHATDSSDGIFAGALEGEIAALLGTAAVPDLVTISVVPHQDGHLQPLQLSRLDMTVLGTPGVPARLCLLGNVFTAKDAGAEPSAKTELAFDGAQDEGFAVSVSESLVATLMCPSLTDGLVALGKQGTTSASMPPSCGTGSGITIPENKDTGQPESVLTGARPRLGPGAVFVDVTATTSGFCYTADVDFTIVATPRIGDVLDELAFDLSVTKPDITTHLDGWCVAAVVVADYIVFGLANLIGVVVGEAIVGAIAIGAVESSASGQVQAGVQASLDALRTVVQVDVLDGIWSDVTVTSERLTVRDRLNHPERPTGVATGWDATPRVDIVASITPVGGRLLVSPTDPEPVWHSTSCPVGDFPYQEYHQSYAVAASLRAWLACRPYQLEEWSIVGTDGVHILAPGSNQSVTFETDCVYVTGASGAVPTTTTRRKVTLEYSLDASGFGVAVTQPSDGSYTIPLLLHVVDAHGADMQTSLALWILGDDADIEGGYDTALRRCREVWQAVLDKERHEAVFGAPVGPGDPGPYAGAFSQLVSDPSAPVEWQLASKLAPLETPSIQTRGAFSLGSVSFRRDARAR